MNYWKILFWITGILLAITIIIGPFTLLLNSKDFYYSEYEKNGVYFKLDVMFDNNGVEVAHNATLNIFKFFRGQEDLKYFNDAEKSHMMDVRNVINGVRTTYYVSAALLTLIILGVMFFYGKHHDKMLEFFGNITFYGSILSLVFLLLAFLSSVLNFDKLFVAFHLLFFPQGNWLFPANSLLITLFPEQFFFDISVRIFLYGLFSAIVFLALGLWIRKHIKLIKKFRRNN